MPQETTNQNTQPCKRRADIQRPVPVKQSLKATSITNIHLIRNCLLQLWNCLWHCFSVSSTGGRVWETRARSASVRSGDRFGQNMSLYWERCLAVKMFCNTSMEMLAAWDGARTNGALLEPEFLKQAPVTSGSCCERSVVFAGTAVRPDDRDHTTHRTPHTAHRTVTVAEGRQRSDI